MYCGHMLAGVKMEINGSTKLMGVIGNPVFHSFSPFIHNAIAQKLGDNIVYTAFNVDATDFTTAVKGAEALGIIGLNVTAPHKSEAARLAVSVDALAMQADAVNLLKLTEDGYIGYNTDIYGVRKAFEHMSIDVTGKTAALVGAGGAGRASALAMAQMGAKKIHIINRTRSKAEVLANILEMHYNINIDICELRNCDADILILATTPEFVPQELGRFNTIFDVNYYPANRVPCAFGGLEMLVYQAVQTYEIVLGVTVPVTIIDEILTEIKGRLLC